MSRTLASNDFEDLKLTFISFELSDSENFFPRTKKAPVNSEVYLSLNSTSCMFVPLRSEASDVGVGGYSGGFPPGRRILRIQGNQYRKTILTWFCVFGS